MSEKKTPKTENRPDHMPCDYRDMLMNAPIGIFTSTSDGRFVYVNTSLARMFGYESPREMIDSVLNIGEQLYADPQEREEFKRLLEKNNENLNYECRLVRRDGSLFWASYDARVVRDKKGEIVNYQGFLSDITEQKQERESLLRTQFAMDRAPDSILWIDDKGYIVYANESACTSMGYAREELLTMKVFDIDPDFPLDNWEWHKEEVRRRGSMSFESRHRTKDGRLFPVEVRTNYFKYNDLYLACAFDRDITERKQAEEALRESEGILKSLLDATPVGVALLKGQVFEKVNKALCSITGYNEEEMVGKRTRILYPDDKKFYLIVREMYNRMKRDGLGVKETILQRKDGAMIDVMLSLNPFDPEDFSEGACATVQDITERKRVEEVLHRRLIYENLLSRISTMAVAAGDLNDFLDKSIALMGETIIVSRSYIFEHCHETDTMDNTHEWCAEGIVPQKENLQGLSSGIIPWWVKTLKSGEDICFTNIEDIPDEGTKKILRPQGILSILVVPLFVEGRYYGFIGFDDCLQHRVWPKEDVNLLISASKIIALVIEREQAEEEVRKSEEQYRFLTEIMTDIVWTLDLDFKTTFVSPSITKILGFTPEERMLQEAKEIMTQDSYETAVDTLARELKMEQEGGADPDRFVVIETEYYHKEGHTVWLESAVHFIRDYDGNPIGIHGVSRDITERKRAEEEREKLKEQLNRAQKLESIGTLAGGIAHDFNNLLMGIQGHASLMMLDLDSSHPHHERLKQIENQVKSGAELTCQLLGFARGGRYELKATDMNDVIEATSVMFGRTKKEITIHKKFKQDLWVVEADQTQMGQVFMNLFVNAWQAMPGGGEIFLETDNFHITDEEIHPVAPGKYVRIIISDTGVGMDAQTCERIFDPFFTTKEMGRGTGLGLATVYGIINGHGGMIDVTSEPGQGTTFEIYLPATEKTIIREKIDTTEISKGTETILLVDDEVVVLDVAREMLQSLGYRVYCSENGREALAIYHEKKTEIDLVILDMIMPGMSGSEVFDRLQEIDPKQKVLLSSGYSINGEAQSILERGCNGFLQKPYQVEELAGEVRSILDT